MNSVMAAVGASQNREEGTDNPGATDEEGARLRAEQHVITSQPQISQVEESRAPLPISTINWRSTPGGQFLPIHGLDFLIGVPVLTIQQTVELGDLMTTIESENRYMVKVPGGETLFIASETSSSTQRVLCGAGRSFCMRLHDATRQEALVLQRRLAAASCLFPCRLQEMKVVAPPGNYLGRVQQQWTLMVPFFLVRDASENVLYIVEGPNILPCTRHSTAEFKVLTGDSLMVQGSIKHAWDRELVTYLLTINFPRAAADPKHKALLVAAAFLLYIQNYKGCTVNGIMHGDGEYRWRFLPDPMPHVTYEGHFYANCMEGYGITSYADGTVFRGLFHDNYRFGPGIETTPHMKANVGLWLGGRLVRLACQPNGPSLLPDLAVTSDNLLAIIPYRIKLRRKTINLEEENHVLEVSKGCRVTKEQAEAHSQSLNSKLCTHPDSAFFERCVFDKRVFGCQFDVLEVAEISDKDFQAVLDHQTRVYNSWNNTEDILQMMCHTFKHHLQRDPLVSINIEKILSGNRSVFRPPDIHEMDCRSVLLASYLGDVLTVANLVNDRLVPPNISDCKGNSALMYACCADRRDVISFLLVAGAGVDGVNDACLTPLSMSLLRYVATMKDASINDYHKLFMPPDFIPSDIDRICQEWNIIRSSSTAKANVKQNTKQNLKPKSTGSIHKISTQTNAGEVNAIHTSDDEEDAKEEHILFSLQQEFKRKQVQSSENALLEAQYVFEVENILENVDLNSLISISKPMTKGELDITTPNSKSNVVIREVQHNDATDETASITSSVKHKIEKLANIESTIQQLLSSGADPELGRFPLPPLAVAMFSGNTTVVRRLVQCGSDVNENFPQLLNYRALDIALSRPIAPTTLELVQCLLDCGASVDYHIQPKTVGLSSSLVIDEESEDNWVTPLHILVNKLAEYDTEAEIQKKLVELLLNHGANSIAQYQGHSALDYAMNKRLYLLETFARNRTVDLNTTINKKGQVPLTKFLTVEYFASIPKPDKLPLLFNLLDFGANPLRSIRQIPSEEESFKNVFEFIEWQLEQLKAMPEKGKQMQGDPKAKKSPKTVVVQESNLLEDYREALNLMKQYARIQHISWLQMHLLVNLMDLVNKFKHRAWHMIVKEHEFTKQTSLWLTPGKSLEVWDIIKMFSKKRKYWDAIVIYKTLCIVMYYNMYTSLEFPMWKLTIQDCEIIERNVKEMIKQHRGTLSKEFGEKVFHSKPSDYSICFECSLPLGEEASLCQYCHLVWFCTGQCSRIKNCRTNCHPCAAFLQTAEECTQEEN